MLQTVRDACQFDPKAIDYALSDQIESLDDLVGHEPGAGRGVLQEDLCHRRHANPAAAGAPAPRRRVGPGGLRDSSRRWAAARRTPCSPSAISAANPDLATLVPKDVTKGFTPATARVVAISGRSVSRDKHLWGDIADAARQGRRIRRVLSRAPQGAEREGLDRPDRRRADLILLDELPPYFGYARDPDGRRRHARRRHGLRAVESPVGGARSSSGSALSISNLSGSYQDATKQISALVQKAVGNLQQETARQAKSITPVELGSDEIYHILRTRLLRATPDARRRRRRRDRLLRGDLRRGEVEDGGEVRRADRRRDRRLLSVPSVASSTSSRSSRTTRRSARPAA